MVTDPAPPPALEFTGVSKSYGPVRALRSVSLRLDRGESAALAGSNGAGKTTILKIAATHTTPGAGTVRICGEDAKAAGSALRSRIGFAGHESFLYPELTVRENLRYYARFLSVPEQELQPLVSRFGLTGWYDREAKKLSFGLRKRADIIRATMHRPAVLLLDEPFSGLDAPGCGLLVDFIREQQRGGTAVLLSSHSRSWAGKACTRTFVLDRGMLAEEPAGAGPGGPDEEP